MLASNMNGTITTHEEARHTGAGHPQRVALIIPLAFPPLVNYVVSFVGQYRSGTEGMLLLLASVEVRRWIKPTRMETQNRRSNSAAKANIFLGLQRNNAVSSSYPL